MQLEFNMIDIKDEAENCTSNYISFGDSKDEEELPRFCNQIPTSKLAFTSNTKEVVIKLVTGMNNSNSRGFDADFHVYRRKVPIVTTGPMIDTTAGK